MISPPSFELMAVENPILQVTVTTEFLKLPLIAGYTFLSVGIILPLFYKCTPTQKSFVLKYSLLSFTFMCLKMWMVLNYLCYQNLEVVWFCLWDSEIRKFQKKKEKKKLLLFCRSGLLKSLKSVTLSCFMSSRDLASAFRLALLSFPRMHPTVCLCLRVHCWLW